MIQTFWQWLTGLEGGAVTFVSSFAGFLFGLFALVLGALFNYHLNRRRDKRIREDEARSVAAAIYGEIIFLQKELARIGKLTAKTYFQSRMGTGHLRFDNLFLERTHLPSPTLYNALANKLGLLKAEHLLAITEFYDNYQTVQSCLPLLVEDENRGFFYSPLMVLEPARDSIEKMEPTLRSLENILNIAKPALKPDLDAVLEAIDHERIIFEEN